GNLTIQLPTIHNRYQSHSSSSRWKLGRSKNLKQRPTFLSDVRKTTGPGRYSQGISKRDNWKRAHRRISCSPRQNQYVDIHWQYRCWKNSREGRRSQGTAHG